MRADRARAMSAWEKCNVCTYALGGAGHQGALGELKPGPGFATQVVPGLLAPPPMGP